jgi:predicted nucleic acid-binding protein
LPDSIIASTAIYLQFPFVTSDNQFKTIANLDLVYYKK